MKRIYKILIAVIAILFVSSGIIAYAYYATHDNGHVVNGRLDIEEENIVEVSSFNEFIEATTVDKFNDHNKTSNVSSRLIIKLTDDIKLASNLVLTKDIHIDLNGNTLDLDDKTLTIKHAYAGCFMIYNGTVESGAEGDGKIIVDTPLAGLQTDSIDYEIDGVATTEANVLEIHNLDEKYTIYSALYLIGNQLASDVVRRPVFKTFDEVSSIQTFTPNLFIIQKTCELNDDTVEACSYIYEDLDLPSYYLSTDISITYESSDTTILDDDGCIKGFGDVNLTATIEKDGWTSVSVTFPLHVVDLTDAQTVKDIVFYVIKDYLEPYYVDESLVVKDQVILNDYYYRFEHALTLPKTIFDGKIELSYKTTNLVGTDNPHPLIYQNDEDENTYMYEPSMNDYHLVTIVGDDELSLNMYSTYVVLEEIVAYYIANYLYGGSIIYDRATTGKELVYLNNINSAEDGSLLYALKQYIASYNVTSIGYTLTGDVAEDYKIEDGYLKLKGTDIPEDKESSVTLTVGFEGGKSVDIDLNVEYLDSSGSTLSSYLTYYNIYNALVPTELETYFDLPFATNNIAPYTCYDVAHYTTEKVTAGSVTYTEVHETLYKPQNLKIALWYDGQQKLVFNAYNENNPQSFTNQLDAYLTANNITLQQIAAKTGANQAFYRFSIDAQNSLNYNDNFVIIYNYKFEQIAPSWSRYEFQGTLTDNNTSYLTVLGGLFYNTTGTVDYCVRNANFFVWIYNKFRPQLSDYSDITTATADRIIPINWLGQFAVITREDSALANVTDFSGIKYLTSVTEVDLTDNGSLSQNVLNGISEMKSLKKLVLKNCGLTDISSLAKLANQGTLKILDISDNNIMYFDGITTIKSLEKVYLYNNYATHDYYGSKGICNFQAFADLMKNGTSVYNDTSNTIPLLYAESNNLDDYRRLKEICYQDKLKDGLDIRNLYDEFIAIGTTITSRTGNQRPGNNPFGLQTAGILSWGYQGDATEGAKYLEQEVTVGATITGTYYEYANGAYSQTTDTTFVEGKTYFVLATYSNATYFYVTLTYSTGYKLTVKYYVDRY